MRTRAPDSAGSAGAGKSSDTSSRARRVCGSLLQPWHQVLRVPVHRALDLDLLYRARRIDVLGADLGTRADERAFPCALGGRDHLLPLVAAAVARILVVAVRKRDRRRTDV